MNLPDQIEAQPGAIKIEWLAKKLSISRKTLYLIAARGKLPCFLIDGCVRLNPKSVADWLRRRMLS